MYGNTFANYCAYFRVTRNAILHQCFEYPGDVIHEQEEAKGVVHRMKRKRSMQAADSLKQTPWTWLRGKALLFGSPPSPFRNLVLLFTNELIKMPWLSLTAGNHCKLALLVLVVRSSPLNMFYHALRVVSLPLDILKSCRDLTANLLTEVCNDVSIEPELLTIDGEVFTGTLLSHTVGMVQD